MKPKICCMNCEYYFADPLDNSHYTIDKEIIDPEISHIVKCQAFSEWFGVVE